MERMSYVSSYFHCVFSTKERRRFITPALRDRLWPFMGGIARHNKMKTIEIGGVEDHVHILLSLPPTLPISKALQLIKGGSSKWVHGTYPEHRLFGWQEEIRGIQRERVPIGQDHSIHQGAGGASSQDDVSRGVRVVIEETSDRAR
jgi:REP element-mobilizing transposase RayT